jgi:hypothetical protein
MYPLHFGNFAGAVSKAVWVTLGFAAAYVTLTGMLLWTRRREAQSAWRRMACVVHYVGYGLPLALVCAPYAFFALRDSETDAGTSQGIAFLAVAAVTALVAFCIGTLDRLRRRLLASTGVAMLGLPLMRMATGGLGWLESYRAGISAVPAVDIAFGVAAVACLWTAFRRQQPSEVTEKAGAITSEAQAT